MRTMKKMLPAAILFALAPAWCFGVDSRPTFTYSYNVKPSIVHQENGDGYTGGLAFDGSVLYDAANSSDTLANPKGGFARFKAEWLLTGDGDHNSKPLRAELVAGASLHWQRPKRTELGPNPGDEIVTQEGFERGRWNAGLNVGYETDQALDNRNVTAGGELGYVLTVNEGWRALIPSLYAQYEWVSVQRSEIQRAANIDDTGYPRYRVSASWKMPVGDLLPPALKPLQLHLDVRYYKDFQRPEAIERSGMDESRYVAGALSYNFRSPVPLGTVSGVFVKVSRGRIPPVVQKATDVYIGFVLWEK